MAGRDQNRVHVWSRHLALRFLLLAPLSVLATWGWVGRGYAEDMLESKGAVLDMCCCPTDTLVKRRERTSSVSGGTARRQPETAKVEGRMICLTEACILVGHCIDWESCWVKKWYGLVTKTVGFQLSGLNEELFQASNIRERRNHLLWYQITGTEKQVREARWGIC